MPVLTRSNTNNPIKMVSGVKRKFIEIVDSDSDDTTTITTSSETDSEFEYDQVDELKDTIDDLKQEIKDHEDSYNIIVDVLVRERTRNNELEAEIAKLRDENTALRNVMKSLRHDAYLEILLLSGLLTTLVAGSGYLYWLGLSQ